MRRTWALQGHALPISACRAAVFNLERVAQHRLYFPCGAVTATDRGPLSDIIKWRPRLDEPTISLPSNVQQTPTRIALEVLI
ncbi:hypothetical protein CC2G_013129 [Coprinopsis cinerea AmutBmut pab1-1]|nr:hypothetical protein CC2G_013129 [Coprinopsis cinerea AmutBmut pab1-1]